MSPEQPGDPNAVWDMIRRADDLVKYAPNRDPGTAHEGARRQLEQATKALAAVPDEKVRQALAAQIRRRLEDLDRMSN